MLRSTKDFLAGAFTLLVAGMFYLQGDELTGVSFVFPKILMIFLTVCGSIVIVQGILGKKREKGIEEDDEPVSLKRIAIISIGSIVYVLLMPYLGFYPVSLIFLLLLSFVLSDASEGKAKLVLSIVVFSIVICLSVWIGFGYLLSVPTPEGMLFN